MIFNKKRTIKELADKIFLDRYLKLTDNGSAISDEKIAKIKQRAFEEAAKIIAAEDNKPTIETA